MGIACGLTVAQPVSPILKDFVHGYRLFLRNDLDDFCLKGVDIIWIIHMASAFNGTPQEEIIAAPIQHIDLIVTLRRHGVALTDNELLIFQPQILVYLAADMKMCVVRIYDFSAKCDRSSFAFNCLIKLVCDMSSC